MNKMFTNPFPNQGNKDDVMSNADISMQRDVIRATSRNAWFVAVVAFVVAVITLCSIPDLALPANMSPEEIVPEAIALEARHPLAKVVLLVSETVALLSIYVGIKSLKFLHTLSTLIR